MRRGYFRSPDGKTINGVEQLQIFNQGPIPGGFLVFCLLKILEDVEYNQSDKAETPEATVGFADRGQLLPAIAELLTTRTMTEATLCKCPPSQQALLERLHSEGSGVEYWDKMIGLYGSLLSPAYLALWGRMRKVTKL